MNTEWTEQHAHVYAALEKAASRIGETNYKTGLYAAHYRNGKCVSGYRISKAHETVIEAMRDLCHFKITPDQAMAILHNDYEVDRERFGGKSSWGKPA